MKRPVSSRAFCLRILTPRPTLRTTKLEGHTVSCRARNSSLNPIFLILLITAPGQAGREARLPMFVVGNDNGKNC